MDNTSKRRNKCHVLYFLARGFCAKSRFLSQEIPPLRKSRWSDFPLLRTFRIFTVESSSPRTFPDRINPASFHFQGIPAFLVERDSGGSDSIGVRTEPSWASLIWSQWVALLQICNKRWKRLWITCGIAFDWSSWGTRLLWQASYCDTRNLPWATLGFSGFLEYHSRSIYSLNYLLSIRKSRASE
jgi:hypothetical protein